MKRLFYVGLFVMLGLIIGCDSRKEILPSMSVTLRNDVVTNELGWNEMYFDVYLDGPDEKTLGRKIVLDFDDSIVHFNSIAGYQVSTSDGSVKIITSSTDPIAKGYFTAQDVGMVNVHFEMDDYPKTNEDISFMVHDMPDLELIGNPTMNHNSNVSLQCQLTSSTDFVSNLKLKFEVKNIEQGSFSGNGFTFTDENGIGEIIFTSTSDPNVTFAEIVVYLADFPDGNGNPLFKDEMTINFE